MKKMDGLQYRTFLFGPTLLPRDRAPSRSGLRRRELKETYLCPRSTSFRVVRMHDVATVLPSALGKMTSAVRTAMSAGAATSHQAISRRLCPRPRATRTILGVMVEKQISGEQNMHEGRPMRTQVVMVEVRAPGAGTSLE